MKFLLNFLVVSISLVPITNAARAATIPNSVIQEILKYNPQTPLTQDYVKSLVTTVQGLAQKNERTFKASQTQNCENSMSISMPGSLTKPSTPEAASFEAGFIVMEISQCFKPIEPKKLIELIGSRDFKLKAFSGMITSLTATLNGNGITYDETTTTPLKGNSHYTYTQTPLEFESDYALAESRLTSNDTDFAKFKNPIFFRYTLTSAKKMQEATALHIVTYTRAADLTGIPDFLLKSAIKKNQEKFIEVLSSSLASLTK